MLYKVTNTRGIYGKGSGTGACFRTRLLKVRNSQEDGRKVKEEAPLMLLWPPTICYFVTFSNFPAINVSHINALHISSFSKIQWHPETTVRVTQDI